MSAHTGMARRSPALVIVIGAAAMLAAACSKPATQDHADQPTAAAPAEPTAAPPAEPAAAPPAEPAAAPPAEPTAAPAVKGDRYTVAKDGTEVTLGVTGNKGEIAFELVTQTADPKCKLSVSGTAKEKGGDVETREDEHGEMIAVAEYVYEAKDCWVSISLESDRRSLAWVSTADCTSVPESCWLNSFGPLRKQ